MSDCDEHPGRDAVATCAGCGRALCEECVEVRGDDKAWCYDCAVAGQLAEMERRDGGEAERPEKKEPGRRRFGRWTKVAVIVLSVLVAAEVGFLVYSRTRTEPRPEITAGQQVVYDRDQCIMRMQAVREALDKGRSGDGEYPRSLQELGEPAPGAEPVCPLTGAPYTYEAVGTDYRLSCPNPEKHGVGELTATSGSVPTATGE